MRKHSEFGNKVQLTMEAFWVFQMAQYARINHMRAEIDLLTEPNENYGKPGHMNYTASIHTTLEQSVTETKSNFSDFNYTQNQTEYYLRLACNALQLKGDTVMVGESNINNARIKTIIITLFDHKEGAPNKYVFPNKPEISEEELNKYFAMTFETKLSLEQKLEILSNPRKYVTAQPLS